jgi:RNA polymerase sigma factor (sigma-70 family)
METESESDYAILYKHYYHYLTLIGLKKGADPCKTKDCINDLFLYIWENRKKIGNVRDHHNYMITAFLRKLFRKENFSTAYDLHSFDLPDYTASSSVETLYIRQNTQAEVSKTLIGYVDQLPEKQRQMIYQKFYLGLSYHQISDSNNVSINTVYNTIYKAVDKLKVVFDKDVLICFEPL